MTNQFREVPKLLQIKGTYPYRLKKCNTPKQFFISEFTIISYDARWDPQCVTSVRGRLPDSDVRLIAQICIQLVTVRPIVRSSKHLVPSGAKNEIHQAVRYQWRVQGSCWVLGVSKGTDTLMVSQNQGMNAVSSLYFRILFCVSDWIFVFPNHSLSFRVKTQISNAL